MPERANYRLCGPIVNTQMSKLKNIKVRNTNISEGK